MVEMESNANGETAKPPKPVQAEEAKPTAKANAGEEEQKKDQPGVGRLGLGPGEVSAHWR